MVSTSSIFCLVFSLAFLVAFMSFLGSGNPEQPLLKLLSELLAFSVTVMSDLESVVNKVLSSKLVWTISILSGAWLFQKRLLKSQVGNCFFEWNIYEVVV